MNQRVPYPFDFNFITPEQAAEMHIDENRPGSVEHYRKMAKSRGVCSVCEQNYVWRFCSDTHDMCFSCITGSIDASEDYELIPE